MASINGRYSSDGAINTYSQNAKTKEAFSSQNIAHDKTYQSYSTTIPVVTPMTTFSPPSNPVVHHSLIGPMAFVGIPPSEKKDDKITQKPL
jgi:hypothetical protein